MILFAPYPKKRKFSPSLVVANRVFAIYELITLVIEFIGVDQIRWMRLFLVDRTWYNVCHSLNLVSLTVKGDVQDERLLKWVKLPWLNRLSDVDLSGSLVTDRGLHMLTSLVSLKRLKLCYCPNVTDKGLKSLSTIVSLQCLDMESCENITDDGIQALSSLPKLDDLGLGSCQKITQKGIELAVSSHPGLQSLSISGCVYAGPKITDEGLPAILRSVTHLQRLNVSCCYDLTPQSFVVALPHLEKLKYLDLSWCTGIDDLWFLSQLPQLSGLNLAHCCEYIINDRNMRVVFGLRLQSLNLACCHSVTDTLLQVLVSSTLVRHLQRLNLSCCDNVTNKTFKQLLPCLKSLKSLDVSNCRGVNNNTLKLVRSWLQNLESMRLDSCQNITNTGLQTMLRKHLYFLHELSVGNCFKLTEEGIALALSCSKAIEVVKIWR